MLKADTTTTDVIAKPESDLFYWRKLLENRKKLLAEDETQKKQAIIELSAEENGDLSKIPLHPADMASNTQEIGILRTFSEKNIKALHEIEDALERIDRGVYGFCLSCEEPIPRKRLELVPESRYCLECKEDLEKAQKIYHV